MIFHDSKLKCITFFIDLFYASETKLLTAPHFFRNKYFSICEDPYVSFLQDQIMNIVTNLLGAYFML